MDEARGLSSFSSVGYLGPNWNRTGIEKKREKKKKDFVILFGFQSPVLCLRFFSFPCFSPLQRRLRGLL